MLGRWYRDCESSEGGKVVGDKSSSRDRSCSFFPLLSLLPSRSCCFPKSKEVCGSAEAALSSLEERTREESSKFKKK